MDCRQTRLFVAAAAALVAAAAAWGCGQLSPTAPTQAPPPRAVGEAIPPPRPADTGKVYALVVADTDAEPVVPGFTLDVAATAEAVERLLTGGVGADRRQVVRLEGKDVTPGRLRAEIEKFPITPADALVCFFAGHAAYNLSRADAHVLFLHGGPKIELVDRAALRGWMTGRKPQLAVLVTETSQGVLGEGVKGPARTGGTEGVEGVAAEVTAAGFPPPADPSVLRPGFRQLLLKSSGLVDLNGADDGTSSWSPTGEPAFFARSLARVLADGRDDVGLTWPEVYRRTRASADHGFRAWRTVELGRLRTSGNPLAADRRTAAALTGLPYLTPRAYHLPDAPQWAVVEPAAGGGLAVLEVPLDSPLRPAGVKAGDAIVKAQGEDTPSADRWERVVGRDLGAGRRTFTLRVRGADRKERDVVVELPK